MQSPRNEDLDKLIKNLEFENQQYVKLIEKEKQQITVLENDIEFKKSMINKLQASTTNLDEETKAAHRQFTQNRQNCESLRTTSNILYEHEVALEKKLQALLETKQRCRAEQESVRQHYQTIWSDYEKEYQSWTLAKQLEELREINRNAENALMELKSQKDTLTSVIEKMKLADENYDRGFKNCNEMGVQLARMKLDTNQCAQEIKNHLDAIKAAQRQIEVVKQQKKLDEEQKGQQEQIMKLHEETQKRELAEKEQQRLQQQSRNTRGIQISMPDRVCQQNQTAAGIRAEMSEQNIYQHPQRQVPLFQIPVLSAQTRGATEAQSFFQMSSQTRTPVLPVEIECPTEDQQMKQNDSTSQNIPQHQQISIPLPSRKYGNTQLHMPSLKQRASCTTASAFPTQILPLTGTRSVPEIQAPFFQMSGSGSQQSVKQLATLSAPAITVTPPIQDHLVGQAPDNVQFKKQYNEQQQHAKMLEPPQILIAAKSSMPPRSLQDVPTIEIQPARTQPMDLQTTPSTGPSITVTPALPGPEVLRKVPVSFLPTSMQQHVNFLQPPQVSQAMNTSMPPRPVAQFSSNNERVVGILNNECVTKCSKMPQPTQPSAESHQPMEVEQEAVNCNNSNAQTPCRLLSSSSSSFMYTSPPAQFSSPKTPQTMTPYSLYQTPPESPASPFDLEKHLAEMRKKFTEKSPDGPQFQSRMMFEEDGSQQVQNSSTTRGHEMPFFQSFFDSGGASVDNAGNTNTSIFGDKLQNSSPANTETLSFGFNFTEDSSNTSDMFSIFGNNKSTPSTQDVAGFSFSFGDKSPDDQANEGGCSLFS